MPTFFSIFFKIVIPVVIFTVGGYKLVEVIRANNPAIVVSANDVANDKDFFIASTTSEADVSTTANLDGATTTEPETESENPPILPVAEEKEDIVQTTVPVVIPQISIPQPFEFDAVWRDSVVNLLCTNRYGEVTDVFSGSGILVDSQGVILTNAHVAIEFLFANWPNPSLNECSVRIGSPASPRYRASILYIPDEFVVGEIAGLYEAEDSRIYGKNDYAFLVITGTTDPNAKLPESFPHLSTGIGPAPAINSPVFLIGYPASFLSGMSIQRDLYLLSSPAVVNIIRSLDDGMNEDVIAFGGNIIGQHGSSGGGVIGPGGVLTGLMTFFDKDYGYTTSERILNAITLGYINRDLKQDTGSSLQEFLAEGDFITRSEHFMANEGARYQQLFANKWREKQGIIIPGVVY